MKTVLNLHCLHKVQIKSRLLEVVPTNSKQTDGKNERGGAESQKDNIGETSVFGEEFQNESNEAGLAYKSEKFVDSKPGQKREREDGIEPGSVKKKEKMEPGLVYLLAKLTPENL